MELNDQVVVTLTAAGARHLNAFYGYYAKKFPSPVSYTHLTLPTIQSV